MIKAADIDHDVGGGPLNMKIKKFAIQTPMYVGVRIIESAEIDMGQPRFEMICGFPPPQIFQSRSEVYVHGLYDVISKHRYLKGPARKFYNWSTKLIVRI